jgi:hypothetical protein
MLYSQGTNRLQDDQELATLIDLTEVSLPAYRTSHCASVARHGGNSPWDMRLESILYPYAQNKLKQYSSIFPTAEIDSTFYSLAGDRG